MLGLAEQQPTVRRFGGQIAPFERMGRANVNSINEETENAPLETSNSTRHERQQQRLDNVSQINSDPREGGTILPMIALRC